GAVTPPDERGRGAKVRMEVDGTRSNCADSVSARPLEQPDVSVAKAVDRLHRITHSEERPTVARLPFLCQPHQQPMLYARGVLKFVDEQVFDSIVERKSEVGGCVRVSEGPVGREAEFREIRDPRFAKHLRKPDGCKRESGDDRDHRLGSGATLRNGWQTPQGCDRWDRTAATQVVDQRAQTRLLGILRCVCEEALGGAKTRTRRAVERGNEFRNEPPRIEISRQPFVRPRSSERSGTIECDGR